MKTQEFYKKLFACGGDYDERLIIHYGVDEISQIRLVSKYPNVVVLSNEYGSNDVGPVLSYNEVLEKIEDFLEEDCDVVFSYPSKGIFRIVDVKREPLEPASNAVSVYCEDEPICAFVWTFIKKYLNKRVTEGYVVQNIDEKNSKVIEALRTGLKNNIEKCLKEIDSLKSSVSLYRDSVVDYVDLAVEKSDIVAKYSKANNAGTYNLPGVFASSASSYDLDAMRADNQRIEQVKSQYDIAEGQKDTYFKMIVRAQNEMKLYLTAIARMNTDLEIYLEQLAQETSWESNKNIKK